MEAARASVTSVDNYFTRQYIPEEKSELVKLVIVKAAGTYNYHSDLKS
jgi:hypothetical protein